MNNIPTVLNDAIVRMAANKEQVIKGIMQQVLKREPTMSDAPAFEFIRHELYPGREYIGYNGNLLGEIVFSSRIEGDKGVFSIEFIPKSTFA